MAVTISGKLIGPNGDPRAGVTIQLRAVKTSSAVVVQAPSTSVTGSDGSYSLSVQVGTHEVMIEAYGQPYERVGSLTVYADSHAGSLNDFLTLPSEDMLTPEIVALVDSMRSAASTSEKNAKTYADQTKEIYQVAQNGADSYATVAAAQAAVTAGTEKRQYLLVRSTDADKIASEYEVINGVVTSTGKGIASDANVLQNVLKYSNQYSISLRKFNYSDRFKQRGEMNYAVYPYSTLNFNAGSGYVGETLKTNATLQLSNQIPVSANTYWALCLSPAQSTATLGVVAKLDSARNFEGLLYSRLPQGSYGVVPLGIATDGYIQITTQTTDTNITLYQVTKEIYAILLQNVFKGARDYLVNLNCLNTPVTRFGYYARQSVNNGVEYTYPLVTTIGTSEFVRTKPVAVTAGQFLHGAMRSGLSIVSLYQCDVDGNFIADLTATIPFTLRGPGFSADSYVTAPGGATTVKDITQTTLSPIVPSEFVNMPITFTGYVAAQFNTRYTDNFLFATTGKIFLAPNTIVGKVEVDKDMFINPLLDTNDLVDGYNAYNSNTTALKSSDLYILPKGQILRALYENNNSNTDRFIQFLPVDRKPSQVIFDSAAEGATAIFRMLPINYADVVNGVTQNCVSYYRNDDEDVAVRVFYTRGSNPTLEIISEQEYKIDRFNYLKTKSYFLPVGYVATNNSTYRPNANFYGMTPILLLKGEVAIVKSNTYGNGYSDTGFTRLFQSYGMNGIAGHGFRGARSNIAYTAYSSSEKSMFVSPLFSTAGATVDEYNSIMAADNFNVQFFDTWEAYTAASNAGEVPCPILPDVGYAADWADHINYISANKNVGSFQPYFLPKGKTIRITRHIVNSGRVTVFTWTPSTKIMVSLPNDVWSYYGPSCIEYTAVADCYLMINNYSHSVYSENLSWQPLWAATANKLGVYYPTKKDLEVTNETLFTIDAPNVPLTIKMFAPIAYDVTDARVNTTGKIEFYRDNQRIFRANIAMEVSGNASANQSKKGQKLTITNANGDSIAIKIGHMMATDKLRLMAYVTEGSHVRDLTAAEMWRQIRKAYVYPYDQIFDWMHAQPSGVFVKKDEAQLSTDGFPVKMQVGEAYYGFYTLRSAKDRPNFLMDKDIVNHIQMEMDINYTYLNKPVDYTQWSYRNPKMKGYDDGETPGTASVASATERLFNWWTSCEAGTSDFGATAPDYLNLDSWIDYIILCEVIAHGDGVHNNIILQTWDATHWSIAAYDMDWTGVTVAVTGAVGQDLNASVNVMNREAFAHFFNKFSPRIKARYAVLRKQGMLTLENIESILNRYSNRIPADTLKQDWVYWPPQLEERKRTLDYQMAWYQRRLRYLDASWGYTPANTLFATDSWAIGTVAAGATVTRTTNIASAVVGNNVSVNHTYDLGGLVMYAAVLTNGVVTTTISNNTAADVAVKSGTLYLAIQQ